MQNEKLSSIKTNFQEDYIILGIDEAGRGPVLGPMVYACAVWAKENNDLLKKEFKFADSKTLNEKTRDSIYNSIEFKKNLLDYKVKVLNANDLSNRMLKRNRESLNIISMEAAFDLVGSCLMQQMNIKEVYVDTVGKPEIYQKKFEEKFKMFDIVFTVTTKADSKFPVVSAASIVAKVTRDRILENWVFQESLKTLNLSREFGSGYPGDPNTKKWLRKSIDRVFGFPTLARFSWKTSVNLLKDYIHKAKWENYLDEDYEEETESKFKWDCNKVKKEKNLLNYYNNFDLKYTDILI